MGRSFITLATVTPFTREWEQTDPPPSSAGHPFGATGVRLVTWASDRLKAEDKQVCDTHESCLSLVTHESCLSILSLFLLKLSVVNLEENVISP